MLQYSIAGTEKIQIVPVFHYHKTSYFCHVFHDFTYYRMCNVAWRQGDIITLPYLWFKGTDSKYLLLELFKRTT